MHMFLCLFVLLVHTCYAQNVPNETNLHNGLTEKIGNFSIELLYHTSKLEQNLNNNLILSPITIWTVLAVIAEGASGNTRREINHALRLQAKNINITRSDFSNIAQWLKVKTNTVELAKINAIFVDQQRLPELSFQDTAKGYDTEMVTVNFADALNSANLLNDAISNFTHGKIKKIVEQSDFADAQMLLTSAIYFKGQWTVPFNTTSTVKLPFYDSKNNKIGDVNMMYNRYTYPFANIKQLQARAIELEFGKENRLSMIIMLPNHGVSLEDMFMNFRTYTLDALFEEMRLSKEEYGDDEVDCFIPRFKIESDIDVTSVLKSAMGIHDLFDQSKAYLPYMARTPMYVSKVIHKAQIEVTEEGTTAAAVTTAVFSNRIGVTRFEANRPFTYMIVEKVTNSIVFGGFYQHPSLY